MEFLACFFLCQHYPELVYSVPVPDATNDIAKQGIYGSGNPDHDGYQYTELYYYIWPAVVHEAKFGLVEIGTYIGFLGLFALVVTNTLAKANLVPKHHPYLEESVYHQF